MISKSIKIFVVSALLLLGGSNLHKCWADDYDFPIKSGIIKYDVVQTFPESFKGKEVFYFDDWGKKGAIYTTKEILEKGKKILKEERIIIKFPFGYFVDLKNNTAEKIDFSICFLGGMSHVSEKMKQLQWKQAGEKMIKGRKCTNWIRQDKDVVLEHCVWQDSGIYLESKTAIETRVMTSFQENVSVPKDKIELPKNISITYEGLFGDRMGELLNEGRDFDKQPYVILFNNDAFAYRALREISLALEAYVIANSGKYPKSVDDLLYGPIPYIPANFCDDKDHGYNLKCDFSLDGYTITATPIVFGVSGSSNFVVKTGGEITPKTFKNIKDYTEEDKRLLQEKIEK